MKIPTPEQFKKALLAMDQNELHEILEDAVNEIKSQEKNKVHRQFKAVSEFSVYFEATSTITKTFKPKWAMLNHYSKTLYVDKENVIVDFAVKDNKATVRGQSFDIKLSNNGLNVENEVNKLQKAG